MEKEQLNEALEKTRTAANAVSTALEADVLFVSGNMAWPTSHDLIIKCKTRTKKKNVCLVLVTAGGDVHAGYRIARCLQQKYEKFSIFVPGWCKSTGTLVVSGAHDIYMGDNGELGPLDIQLWTKDDLWVSKSSLVVDAAVRALESTAERMFLQAVKRNAGAVTYKLAATTATELVKIILEPVSAQLDPSEIGENSRIMNITRQYALRLDRHSKNFSSRKSLDWLVQSYPDHGFVIDRLEAKEIFTNVFDPTKEMEALAKELGDLAYDSIDSEDDRAFEIRYLSDEPPALKAVETGGGVAA
jgi:hypothetical protein